MLRACRPWPSYQGSVSVGQVSNTLLIAPQEREHLDQGTDVKRERTGEGARARRGTLRINGSEAGTNAEGTLPDTYLDMRGWGKGLLWVNGNNLGWFWASAGPQARPAGRRRLPAPPAPGAHALRVSERAQLCSTRPCECSSKAAVTAAMIKR